MTEPSPLILVDEPEPTIRRITLNRPEKRNAINTAMRTELFETLAAHDNDPDVHVTIIRGAGPCFSSGYDLGGGLMENTPYHSAPGDGQWARQATDGWFSMWDLAKPTIAQVHGYAYAGGTELATACDLVYVADDAQIGYPVTRVISPPDWAYHTPVVGLRAAMEMMLTGDAYTGVEAVQVGWANRAFPADELEERVLGMARRVATVAPDLQQINKRLVHRSFEVMGARSAMRVGQEYQALAGHQASVATVRENLLQRIKDQI